MRPQEYLSIAIDGCENMPHGVPHFPEITKNDSSVRLRYHLEVGVVHGRGNFVYDAAENVPSDPNLTIEVLQRIMKSVEDGLPRNQNLPKTLYLQMDNCSRENKNTAMFAYLSWLVERGVFDRVEVSFLPVGHTHNECDQCASRFSVGVRYTRTQSHTFNLPCIWIPIYL
jgi:hypothetical protein